MRFAETVRRYEVAQRATATSETVASPLFRSFAKAVRGLSASLNESDIDEAWSVIIRRLRRTMRELVGTPLSPSNPVFSLSQTAAFLDERLKGMRGSYDTALLAKSSLCATTTRDLSEFSGNPFGDLISEILSTADEGGSVLLVKSPHREEIARWLSDNYPSARLITENELTGLIQTDCLIVAGPSLWYPAHLRSSPRAETICFVYYDAVTDRPQATQLLSGPHPAPGASIHMSRVLSEPDDDNVDAEFLAASVDWNALADLAPSRQQGSSEVEVVQASLFLLAGGLAVYLEAADGPQIDVVTWSGLGAKPQLRRELTRSIEPGDHIVLRSEGGSGDYIPGIADALLGRKAAKYRELQRLWKAALRKAITQKTAAQVNRELRALGITSPNLRYRAWSGSLRSARSEDFRILMEYIGLGDQKDQIWNAMGELADKHQSAGHKVRELLEAKLLKTEHNEIVRTGRLDVRLDDMDAGALSVVRVERKSPRQQLLSEDQIRVIFKVEADLWQG